MAQQHLALKGRQCQRCGSTGPGAGGRAPCRAPDTRLYPCWRALCRAGPRTEYPEQLECIRQAPGAHFSVLFHPKGIQLAPCLLGNVNQMVTGLNAEPLQKPLADMDQNAHPAPLQHGTAWATTGGARPSFCKWSSLRGIEEASRKTVDFRGCSTASALRKSTV